MTLSMKLFAFNPSAEGLTFVISYSGFPVTYTNGKM